MCTECNEWALREEEFFLEESNVIRVLEVCNRRSDTGISRTLISLHPGWDAGEPYFYEPNSEQLNSI